MDHTWMSWSSGKDAALARAAVVAQGRVVTGLLTTVDEATGRVPVHDVPVEVVRAQAAALDLPLHEVGLPWPCPNPTYEQRLTAALSAIGATHLVLGDLHLADVRAYREQLLATAGVEALFPLWGRPTAQLARDGLAGLAAVVCALDPTRVPRELIGARYDYAFLDALPSGVDPCGENGEFHTVVLDAPGFRAPVEIDVGAAGERDGLVVLTWTVSP